MLSDFVKRPAIREAFKTYALRPKMPEEHRGAPLLVPPRKDQAGFIGTAFDYMARFVIARDLTNGLRDASYHVDVHDTGWVAEQSLAMMAGDFRWRRAVPRWTKIVEHAKILQDDFVAGRETSLVKVARCCQCLGALDLLARIGYFKADFWPTDDATDELIQLSSLLDPVAMLQPRRICVLNPCFPQAADIGGADCDVKVDGRMLEIKTTQEMGISSEHLRQVSGYAVLQSRGGCSLGGDVVHDEPPDEVGIYFSRFGRMVSFRLGELFPDGGFDRFADAFAAEMAAVADRPAAPRPPR
jgi:hypothetical protein